MLNCKRIELNRGFYCIETIDEKNRKYNTFYNNHNKYFYSIDYINNEIICRSYYDNEYKLHRKGRPALIRYENGEIIEKLYYNNGINVTRLIERKTLLKNIKDN